MSCSSVAFTVFKVSAHWHICPSSSVLHSSDRVTSRLDGFKAATLSSPVWSCENWTSRKSSVWFLHQPLHPRSTNQVCGDALESSLCSKLQSFKKEKAIYLLVLWFIWQNELCKFFFFSDSVQFIILCMTSVALFTVGESNKLQQIKELNRTNFLHHEFDLCCYSYCNLF